MAVDLEAFDALLHTRSQPLLRAAYVLTGDWALAEDLLQTALTKTYLHWGVLDDVAAGEAYLRKVMFTTYAKWWRRKWHGEVATESLPEGAATDAYAGVDRRDALRRALADLPRRQRAMVVMRFYADMSESDVADSLGVSVGTVKSTTAKALAKLRVSDDLQQTERPRVLSLVDRRIDLTISSATPTEQQRQIL
ncbi:MAG TPA: SigE family RNA polymerase sigma factor [Mycobacteriales bacterium]|jgi:RNA polymerase sigma-70 factor (sigma-E family)|nr:SigE family RNA polymerase sigma factor [Mycobacteriales bacterium]